MQRKTLLFLVVFMVVEVVAGNTINDLKLTEPDMVVPEALKRLPVFKVVMPAGVSRDDERQLVSYLASLNPTQGPTLLRFFTSPSVEYHVLNIPPVRCHSR
ncbi:uncharacterized protein LOC122255279 [Penaeus japonicus]|uniref:uncharacterized protein LOC122255279 n=1 Tax=Penaeus japonicus TaxID=27405 RepID=UPI001C70C703|nr:uncharacterized protein LOC122255279 [Penaeus japonicus]